MPGGAVLKSQANEVARLHGLHRAGAEITAQVEVAGVGHSIMYRFAGVEPDERYEPFVVAATPIAMRSGVPLSVPAPISLRLLQGLTTAQRILHAWFPELEPIQIRAPTKARSAPDGRGVACFFSGGVDSFHSVLRNRDRLDALIHVHGFDVALVERDRAEQVRHGLRRAAAELELPLVEVDTDLRLTSNPYATWGPQYHGAALASIALLTATRFREVLIPASHTYRDLMPWGSHPLLDPLWSTEAVELVHDGAVPRPEKLRVLGDSEIAMRHLRVCFRHGISELNCGRCEKCLRTMAGLRVAGALERCATFPPELSLRRLAWAPVPDESTMAFTRENLEAAGIAGDQELAGALRWMTRFGPWRSRADHARKALAKAVRTRGRRLRRRVRRVRVGGVPIRRRARRLRRALRQRSKPVRRRLRRVRRVRRAR